MYIGASPVTGAASGAAVGTSILPGWGTAIGAAVGTAAALLQGKASDYREWIYFDQNAHYSHTVGDKPNAQTTQMAAVVQQALQGYIAAAEAQGIHFVLPSDFVVNIGSRDPSYLWMPSTSMGDPAKGAGGSKATLAGPNDPNGVANGIVNFLGQFRQGGPGMQPATAAVTSGNALAPPPASFSPFGPAPSNFSPIASSAPSAPSAPSQISLAGFGSPILLGIMGIAAFIVLNGQRQISTPRKRR